MGDAGGVGGGQELPEGSVSEVSVEERDRDPLDDQPRPHQHGEAGVRTRLSVLADTSRETRLLRVTLPGRMKFTLTDEALLPDLLAFLRKAGCVAFYEGGGVEAVRPHSFGEQEATELRTIAKRWRDEHPEVQIEMSE